MDEEHVEKEDGDQAALWMDALVKRVVEEAAAQTKALGENNKLCKKILSLSNYKKFKSTVRIELGHSGAEL